MTAEKILQSDVLDILFEGRNKLYGAYELRRTYHHRIKRAIGGMLFLMALLTGSYLFNFGRQSNLAAKIEYEDTVNLTMVKQPDEPVKPVLPAPKQMQPLDVATVKDFVPVIKPDELVPQTEVPTQTQRDTSAVGTENKDGVASSGQDVTADPAGTPGGKGEDPAPAVSEPALPTGPIDMGGVDELPQYPGGTKALVNYMVRNLTSELEPGVKYMVRAQFVINEEGIVSDAVILQSDDENLNSQVLKAIRKMTRWKPGQLRGHKVAVRFTMPVTFVGPEE